MLIMRVGTPFIISGLYTLSLNDYWILAEPIMIASFSRRARFYD